MDESPDTAPDEIQDTPAEETIEAPEATSDKAAEPDYFDEKFDPASLSDEIRPGWKQIHGRYTQKFQELSEQRQELEQKKLLLDALGSDDPEQKAAALRYLGVDLVDDDEDDDFEDLEEDNGNTELLSRLEKLEGFYQQQTQQAEEAQFEQAINTYLDEQLASVKAETGRDFSEKEQQLLLKVAFASPNDEDLPDVRGAYEALYADFLGEQKQGWTASKQAPQPGRGRAGTQQVDPLNKKSRIAEMAAAIQAGDD